LLWQISGLSHATTLVGSSEAEIQEMQPPSHPKSTTNSTPRSREGSLTEELSLVEDLIGITKNDEIARLKIFGKSLDWFAEACKAWL